MRLINAFVAARDLKNNWLRQYGECVDTKELADRLRALPDEPSPDEVDAVFISVGSMRGGSNRVYREFTCTECMSTVSEVVQINNEVDGGWCPTYLCSLCVAEIFRLLND